MEWKYDFISSMLFFIVNFSIFTATESDKKYLIAELENDKRLIKVIFPATLATGTFYCIFPLLITIFEYLTYSPRTWTLPMKVSMPFEIFYFPTFYIIYAWYVYEVFFVMFAANGIDTIFNGSVCNLCGHFQIIKMKFEKIQLSEMKRGNGRGGSDEIVASKELCHLICYHGRVLDLTSRLCEIYKTSILGLFMFSSLLVCFLCYQLVLSFGSIKVVTYVAFLLAILCQLFIYCSGGTRIETHVNFCWVWIEKFKYDCILFQSVMVLDGIYASEWYKCSPKIRKYILLCMYRASVSCKFWAGIYEASLPTFTAVCYADIDLKLLNFFDLKFCRYWVQPCLSSHFCNRLINKWILVWKRILTKNFNI